MSRWQRFKRWAACKLGWHDWAGRNPDGSIREGGERNPDGSYKCRRCDAYRPPRWKTAPFPEPGSWPPGSRQQ